MHFFWTHNNVNPLKVASVTFQISYRSSILISQVFTYMANSPFEGKKRGALLYPTVVDVVDDRLNTVHGFIFFKSINLDQDWRDISEDLLKFAEKAN